MGAFGFFTTNELRAQGETMETIRLGIVLGTWFRVIRGWYATLGSPKDAVLAMRMGGRLGCVSALALHGAWLPPDAGTHVVFPTAASGRRSAGRERGEGFVRHWHGKGDRTGSSFAVVPIELAIAEALECVPPHLLIAILDSLLHRRLISRNRLEAIIGRGPQRTRHLAGHLEPRSEEGIESIVRYLLAMSGVTAVPQVTMRSRDRLDLEVDDWLVLECDGRETHAKEEAFTRDRDRVVRLLRQARIVLQFPYATIMYEPQTVLAAVRDVMARQAPLH